MNWFIVMADLKLSPNPTSVFSFNTLCLLCARCYAGLGIKIKDHTDVVRSLRFPGVDEQMIR